MVISCSTPPPGSSATHEDIPSPCSLICQYFQRPGYTLPVLPDTRIFPPLFYQYYHTREYSLLCITSITTLEDTPSPVPPAASIARHEGPPGGVRGEHTPCSLQHHFSSALQLLRRLRPPVRHRPGRSLFQLLKSWNRPVKTSFFTSKDLSWL